MGVKSMTFIKRLEDAYETLLGNYPAGVSSTSTSKYNEIRKIVSEAFLIGENEVYVTGTSRRISNLDTRFAQGNQRNKHTRMAVAFISIPSVDDSELDELIIRTRNSAITTSSKFCNGEERGTIFDGILLFLVFEGETKVYPLAFLVFENDFELKEKAEELIPGIELKEYPRANQSPAQENNKSAKNEDEESAKSYVVFLDIEEDGSIVEFVEDKDKTYRIGDMIWTASHTNGSSAITRRLEVIEVVENLVVCKIKHKYNEPVDKNSLLKFVYLEQDLLSFLDLHPNVQNGSEGFVSGDIVDENATTSSDDLPEDFENN